MFMIIPVMRKVLYLYRMLIAPITIAATMPRAEVMDWIWPARLILTP